jgi:hypothetical protein
MYNWSSQKDWLGTARRQGARDRRRDQADHGHAGKDVAQVTSRLALGFALLDLDLREDFLAPAVSPGLGPGDLGCGRDPVGLGPVALALVGRHSTAIRFTDSHGVKFLPPPSTLNGEDCSGTI